MAGSTALVQWRGWNDGDLLGWFNGLQIAARRPPALKAIVIICSTNDRYADDAHYMGGTLLTTAGLEWAFFFFSLMSLPPDPILVGDSWRAMWLERLQNMPLFLELWLQHQRRDAYWKHGSVCEDYAAIQCPVYAVGGWTDGYKNTIPRLLEGLKVPRKGLIGPWAHSYPHFALPGPRSDSSKKFGVGGIIGSRASIRV